MRLGLLDLFSGIGGFSLGLERSGAFETKAFCEIDPFCRRVLAKHWPDVPCYDDVRKLTADALSRDGIAVDAVCGGFPCQDTSRAGPRQGLAGARSGLWREYARILGELRPRFAIVENTPGLFDRGGFELVAGDLVALGYNLWWDCIPASAIGANHKRDRVWIVAYARSEQHEGLGEAVRRQVAAQLSAAAADALVARLEEFEPGEPHELTPLVGARQWASESGLVRVVYGVPDRVDRITALGNAVVPQIPELIGRAIGAALQRSPSC